MIFLRLFLTFFQIGAVSFGGGYAMISLINEKVTAYGWMSDEELLNIIAVSESTPGPIAVNVATFIGASQGGVLGALLATLGVVLPSFIIILIIAALIRNFLKYRGVQAFIGGIRPCVIGLILATSLTLFCSTLFNFSTVGDKFAPDVRGIIIFAIIAVLSLAVKKLLRKNPSPIFLILVSAGLGMALYSF